MVGQSLGLTILATLGVASAIPVVYQIIKNLWNFFYEILSFKNLSIRAIGRTSYHGIPHIMIKSAFVGKGDMIVDEVVIQSKLKYTRRIEAFWEWLRLGIAYFLDDVEGLKSVLGESFFSILWIPVFPFHRINNSCIRKPLNAISGIITFYYFIVCCFPLFWPLLFGGPYQELKLFSRNEDVGLSEKGSKVELKRPFIIKPGFERSFTIRYRPSLLYFDTLFTLKVFIENAKILYVKEPTKLKKTKLPRKNEFTWKVTDVLRVKVCGKMKGYPVKLGDSYVNIRF